MRESGWNRLNKPTWIPITWHASRNSRRIQIYRELSMGREARNNEFDKINEHVDIKNNICRYT